VYVTLISATGETFELAIYGHRLLLCSNEVSLCNFLDTIKGVSFTFCKRWVDATFVAVEKLTRREVKATECLFRCSHNKMFEA
jgi:hypothetical protein